MSKEKRAETALITEEKLERALVPVEQQPYPVPENWCWVILGTLVKICRGASPRPIKSFITDDGSGVNWIKIGDADSGKYIIRTKEKVSEEGAKKSVFVNKGTLLLSNSMSFGRPYILNVDGCIHDGWLAITPTDSFVKEYLYYALMSSEWYFQQVAVGTAVRNLNSERVAKTPVPLPPKNEQHRIIERIESLFAKLDEAKEKAQVVAESFEERKISILRKAFTGELTAQWRQAQGYDINEWQEKELKDICKSMKAGGDKPEDFSEFQDQEHNIPVVANGIADEGIIGYTKHAKYVSGAVTVSGRGTIGYSVYRTYAFYPVIRLVVLCPNGEVDPQFLKYSFDAYPEKGTGSSIPQLTVPSIKEKMIPVPPLDEQRKIVRILDSLLAKEQQAKGAAEAVLDQIEIMKKSILARAFRGELGTNDPTEESAVELLKEVL